jgi:hypothetical protein
MLENSMKEIYTILARVNTGLLKSDNYQFFAHKEILNRHRDFLVSLVEDQNTPLQLKELAVKIILLVGNLRKSGEDYIIVYNLIRNHQLNVNVYSELALTKHLHEEEKDTKENGLKFKMNEEARKEVEILIGLDADPYKNNYTSMTHDKDHVYIF